MLAIIRQIDQGQARATRAALMTASSDGVIPFDLLMPDRFAEVTGRLGAGPARSPPGLRLLSMHERREGRHRPTSRWARSTIRSIVKSANPDGQNDQNRPAVTP